VSPSALKFGALPAVKPAALKDLTWYVAGALPKPPAKVAVPSVPAQSDGTAWGMDGNDNYGDCGVAGLNHGFMCDAAALKEQETFPSADDIVQYYLNYTGGDDTGVVLSAFLHYVQGKGFLDKHTVKAYAPVAEHDIPTLQYAVAEYKFTYTGITVTDQMMTDFNNGQPWTMESVQGNVEGGHCIPIVGYDSQFLYVVTWGAVQPIAYPAWHQISTEAWAIITGEDTTGAVNLAALEADLKKLSK
jgi:hypothetical protein